MTRMSAEDYVALAQARQVHPQGREDNRRIALAWIAALPECDDFGQLASGAWFAEGLYDRLPNSTEYVLRAIPAAARQIRERAMRRALVQVAP